MDKSDLILRLRSSNFTRELENASFVGDSDGLLVKDRDSGRFIGYLTWHDCDQAFINANNFFQFRMFQGFKKNFRSVSMGVFKVFAYYGSSQKFHIGKNGPALCRAEVMNCPIGGDHFDTLEEARAFYEKKMSDQIFASGLSKKDLSNKDLNNLAKITRDEGILKEAAERGSERVLSSLSKNEWATPESLAIAYGRTANEKTKEKIALNPRCSISVVDNDMKFHMLSMCVERRFEDAYLKRKPDIVSDDSFDDDLADKVFEYNRHVRENNAGHYRQHDAINIVPAATNPHNNLSRDMCARILESRDCRVTSGTIDEAVENGTYDPNNIASNSSLYRESVYTKNPNVADVVAREAIRRQDEQYLHTLVRFGGECLQTQTLDNIAKATASQETMRYVWSANNTSEETRTYLESKDEECARLGRVRNLRETYGDVSELITTDRSTVYPSGIHRGYSITTIKVDRDKLKELGIRDDDVSEILQEGSSFNAGHVYDPETGFFEGTHDSTD